MNTNLMFEMYKQDIPKNKVFKSLTQDVQASLFAFWMKNFQPKHIRAELGINFVKYREYLEAFHEGEAPPKSTPGRKAKDIDSPMTERKAAEDRKRVVVEAEIIDITPEASSLAVVNAPTPEQEAPKAPALVSIDTTDTPERICDQLTALLAFLRFQKEPITIKLDVYK